MIRVFFAKDQRADGGCPLMDEDGFCHYVQTDKFGRIAPEWARTREGAGPRMIGKRPDEEGSGDRREGGRKSRIGGDVNSAIGRGLRGKG